MKWGVGTGRCGTKSLSIILGGVHEAVPFIQDEAALYRDGSRDKAILQTLKRKLRKHYLRGLPAVDIQFSYVIPLIVEVDPDAEFVWAIRNPKDMVASAMHKNLYGRTLENAVERWGRFGEFKLHLDKLRIRPKGDLWDKTSQLFRCYWYWVTVNKLIERDLSDKDYTVIFTHQMGDVRANKSLRPVKPLASYKVDGSTWEYITKIVNPYWEELKEKYDGRETYQKPHNVCRHHGWTAQDSPVP